MQRQNKRYQKNKKVRSRKIFYILPAVIIVVLLAGFGVWKFALHDTKQASNNEKSTAQKEDNSPKINYDPPTSQDKTDNDQHKDDLIKQQNQTPPSTNVTLIITSSGQYDGNIEVSAIVPSIVEDGGTCTLTATLGGNKVTRQTAALRNAQSTSCPTFTVPRSEFAAAGNWTINVKYSSSSHNGTSENKTVKVE